MITWRQYPSDFPPHPLPCRWEDFASALGNAVASAGSWEVAVRRIVAAILSPESDDLTLIEGLLGGDMVGAHLDRLEMLAQNRFRAHRDTKMPPPHFLTPELQERFTAFVARCRVAQTIRNRYVHSSYGTHGDTGHVVRFISGDRKTARRDTETVDLRELSMLNRELGDLAALGYGFADDMRQAILGQRRADEALWAEFDAKQRAPRVDGGEDARG